MDSFVKKILPPESASDGSQSHMPDPADTSRPLKRVKLEERSAFESEESEQSPHEYETQIERIEPLIDDHTMKQKFTDVESALPPSQLDEEAIAAYEAFKSSQAESENVASGKAKPLWIKGRSSIYVDAFNLALDTVLDEESKLFDARELDVFRQWELLSYEAQYLYVRLFLRKTAAWHRSNKLGYYSDIADLDSAVEELQDIRRLPQENSQEQKLEGPAGIGIEDVKLGDTFTFADRSDEHLNDVEEAASLLYLDEVKLLAKDAKIPGKNKSELIRNLSRACQQQTGLVEMGLSRQSSRDSSGSNDITTPKPKLAREDSHQKSLFLGKIKGILGPCVRLSPLVFKLFERVHLVFYRSVEWTEKSLTTIILAKIARRNFPEYIVCRSATIFASRLHLLEFEAALRIEAEVDVCLEGSAATLDDGCRKILELFEVIYPRWKRLLTEEAEKEKTVYEFGEGAYLRRFNPGHSYTRVLTKAAYAFGRLKSHDREHSLLRELLDQKLFQLARRGDWYQRKALLEEHHMAKQGQPASGLEMEKRKKEWNKVAAATCEMALQDSDCHLTFHYDLQKRLMKLEKKLRIPRRLQHDFGHVRLVKPMEITVEGIQLKKEVLVKPGNIAAPTKTVWLDELDSGGECSVEEMCLSYFRSQGWKGYHSEGSIVRTLFAYLFYDIMFLYIPNVFQTAYQTCPLDLHTDVFYPARASEINHRLVEIENGQGERLIRKVWGREHERQTNAAGLNWDYDIEDVAELVRCFDGSALASICKVMAQEYRQRGGGVPDLVLWRANEKSEGCTIEEKAAPGKAQGEVMFAEVKSENDRLSDTQRVWIHVLTGAGVKVALCNAVAKEVREVD